MKANGLEQAEEVARDAASDVVGPNSFSELRVTSDEDGMGNPLYLIVFVTDDERAYEPMRRITLTQRIRDTLRANDDAHFPLVQMMGHDDWAKLKSLEVR